MTKLLFVSLYFILLNLDFNAQNLDAERFQSMIDRDTHDLNLVVHDSLVYIHSNGLQESKADFLRSVSSGKIVYQKFQFIIRKQMFKSNSKLAFSGIVLVDGLYDSQAFQVKLAFTSIHVLKHKRFQLIYWQSTKL